MQRLLANVQNSEGQKKEEETGGAEAKARTLGSGVIATFLVQGEGGGGKFIGNSNAIPEGELSKVLEKEKAGDFSKVLFDGCVKAVMQGLQTEFVSFKASPQFRDLMKEKTVKLSGENFE